MTRLNVWTMITLTAAFFGASAINNGIGVVKAGEAEAKTAKPATTSASKPGEETSVADEEIKGILKDRIDRAKKSVGIVVGIVDGKGSRIVSYGKLGLDTDKAVDGDTIFEIGSVTKVFTATLLADMVERGEVGLDDPISKYLPKSVKTPTRNGKEITLSNLATHTAGLPRDPGNMSPKDFDDPYADYTVDKMCEFLSNYTLTQDIGAKFSYSNIGVELLGHILASRAGTDYESLVRSRICQPLKMESTVIKIPAAMQARLATGHTCFLKPVPNWNFNPGLAGAGALRSTANDLLKFIAANMGLDKTPLTAAMEKTHIARNDMFANMKMGLNWFILKKPDSDIVWHSGVTSGYNAFVGFDKKQRRGVVILSNSLNMNDDLGMHILDSRLPLAKTEAPKEHKAVKLDDKLFDACIGEYQVTLSGPSDRQTVVVSREGENYLIKVSILPKVPMFAESETRFFSEKLGATITFVKNEKGEVTQLVYNQGVSVAAKKKAPSPAQ